MTTRSWLRSTSALIVTALAVGVAACGSDDGGSSSSTTSTAPTSTATEAAKPGVGKPPLTIGTKDFTEQFILGELYAQALRAQGYTVTLKSNIGSSEIIDKALTSGKIDLYPEYTGTIVSTLAKITDKPQSADETYEAARTFEAGRGFTTLEKTPFFDADGLAVRAEYAGKNGLKTIADLKKVGAFNYGAPPENRTRFQGVVGLKSEYGITELKFKPLAIGLQYKALASEKIDVAAVFTTDGQLQGTNGAGLDGKYTLLEDTKGIYGYQNVTPVVNDKVLGASPEVGETLNAVSRTLTTEAMQRMNAAVDLDKQKPAEVAATFLKANRLAG